MDALVEKDWREFWVPLVVKDGEVDLEQIKKELFDYHMIMKEVSKVYYEVTGGKVSKPNTAAETVIDMYNDEINKSYAEGIKDGKEECQCGI